MKNKVFTCGLIGYKSCRNSGILDVFLKDCQKHTKSDDSDSSVQSKKRLVCKDVSKDFNVVLFSAENI